MKQTYCLKFMLCLVLAGMAVWTVTGCNKSPEVQPTQAPASGVSGTEKIKVVVAENFYAEAVQEVGGERVEVTSILNNPDQDPHDYEPTVNTSKAVAEAQMVVYTGLGYDDWMAKLINADSSSQTKDVVVVGSGLLGKAAGDNPHVWYDPSAMLKLSQKLAADLGRLDPSHAQDYQKRAKDYSDSLTVLTAKIAKLKQAVPIKVDVSEPVFEYMGNALNLEVGNPAFAKAIEDGNDPSASDFAKVQNDIKEKKIRFFIYNAQTANPTVDNILKLAQENGIPVVKVTETEPAGMDYLQWMTGQLDQVGKALGVQTP